MTHTPPGNAPVPVSTHPLEYTPVTLDGYSSQCHLRHQNENITDTTINDDPDYNIPLPPLQELLQTTMPTATTTAPSHQHQLATEDAQQPDYTTHGTHSFESSFMYNLSIATPATAFVGCSSSNDNQQKTGRDDIISGPLLNNVIKMTETSYSSSSSISPSTPIPIDAEVPSSSSSSSSSTITTMTMPHTKEESGSMNTFRGYRSKSMRVKRSDQVRAMMGEVPQNMPSLLSNHTFIDSAKSFTLTVVEQPKSCRVTGFSNSSDRRPIDPTPIVYLSVTDNNQQIDQESLQNPFYVLHVSLASVDKTKQYDVIVNYPRSRSSNSSTTDEAAAAVASVTTTASKDNNRSRASSSSSSSASSVGAGMVTSFSDMTSTTEQHQSISTSSSPFVANEDSITLEQHQLSPSSSEEEIYTNNNQAIRVLVGSLVSSASTFKGLDDKLGIYFAFPSLSVRVSGTYRLHFTLLSLGRSDKILAEEYSEPFTVYKAKSFPGMEETSLLAAHLYNQGLKLPLRTKPRQKRKQST
ncbi:velvet factor-domain-containing protein [Circinella umbellata]|nr:velvet factor-domain-containing protein [Circinella umbellata]